MRCIKGQVHEERVFALCGTLQEINSIISKDLTPMLASFPKPAMLLVPRLPAIVIILFAFWSIVACLCLIWHARPDVCGRPEYLVGIDFDMPLARHVGIISGIT